MLFKSSSDIGGDNYNWDNINKLTDYILNDEYLRILASKEDWGELFRKLYFGKDVTDFGFLYQYFLDLDAYDILQDVGGIPGRGFSHTFIHFINIPDNITLIGPGCFSHCILLSQVKLPSSINRISTNTFFRCTSLESITIPSEVGIIYNQAFCECKNLKEIIFEGDELGVICEDAFARCPDLKSIKYNGIVKNWKSIEWRGYTPEGLTIHCIDGDIEY